MAKNPNLPKRTFGPDVILEAKKFVDSKSLTLLRSLAKEMAPEGHTYKGSISIHFYEPSLSKELAVITQFAGAKEGSGLLSQVSMPYALFGISNATLELRKLAGELNHASTTNPNDKR